MQFAGETVCECTALCAQEEVQSLCAQALVRVSLFGHDAQCPPTASVQEGAQACSEVCWAVCMHAQVCPSVHAGRQALETNLPLSSRNRARAVWNMYLNIF